MRCPQCGAAVLDPTVHDEAGMVSCACGHRAYAGYVAEAGALTVRLGWLAERIAAGDPAPAPEVARAYAIWPAPAPHPPHRSGLPDPTTPGPVPGPPVVAPASSGAPSAQTILLGLGALLLVVAGVVFVAVTWGLLGAWGQAGLMVLATVGFATLAVRLRRRLVGTAEAMAVVAGGLAAVDLIAAPALGLLPESWITDPTLYPALAIGVLGVVLLVSHQRTGLVAWRWLGWLAVLSATLLVIPAADFALDSAAWTATCLTVPALGSLAMVIGAERPGRWSEHTAALRTVGGLGLFVTGWLLVAAAASSQAQPGVVATLAIAAPAVGVWAALGHRAGWGMRLGPEFLAVVAAGMGAVALVAAPAVGLLPEPWIEDPTLYPALALAALGAGLLLAHERVGLVAWRWLGWLAVLAGLLLVIPAVAAAFDSEIATVASVTVPLLGSVAMLAGAAHPGRWSHHVPALRTVGGLGVLLTGLGTAVAAADADLRVGALITTAAAAVAVGCWAALDRRAQWPLPHAAAGLAGVTVALLLALPTDPQPVWLAAAVALAGLTVGMALWVLQGDAPQWSIPLVGASAVWLGWAALRATTAQYDMSADHVDLIGSQFALLAALVAAFAFAVGWWLPVAGWVGALLAALAMSMVPGYAPQVIEAYSLPLAGLLLVAGLLWRRVGPTRSLVWLGPAVAMALIPSALGSWGAPWALDLGGLSTTGQLVRLGGLLVAGVLAVALGARTRLGGLLIPAALALAITAGAQLWGSLTALPRFLGLAIAGTLLVLAGARIEWLRQEGGRIRSWAQGLR